MPTREELKSGSPEQLHITQEKGTERAFTGKYLNNKAEGIYACVCCGDGTVRFKDQIRFGERLAEFLAAARRRPRTYAPDRSHGMVRTEVTCARMWRAPRSCVRGRPATEWASLLHQFGLARFLAGRSKETSQ